jgi:hypothetical protein
MSKTIEITKSRFGHIQKFTPLIDGNHVLPCGGVVCYSDAQVARAGEILDVELRKVGHTLSEFDFKP